MQKEIGRQVLLKDLEMIDVVCATVHANRAKDVPLWTVFIAPPASLKTEVVNGLRDLKDVYFIDKLTEKTLVSGLQDDRGKDQSLLPRLSRMGKVLMVSLDFGSVLSMRPETRKELLQQLRHVYDGQLMSTYGTGHVVDWKGHLGFIGCATPAIDGYHAATAALGDRFLYFRIQEPPRKATALCAIRNVGKRSGVQRAIRRALSSFLSSDLRSVSDIGGDGTIEERLAALADFLTRARSPVLRNQNGEIVSSTGLEGPGRVAGQLMILSKGLAAVRGNPQVREGDFKTTRRVAMDSLPPERRLVLQGLQAGVDTVKTLGEVGRLTNRAARDAVAELAYLGLLDRTPGNPIRWSLSREMAELLTVIEGSTDIAA